MDGGRCSTLGKCVCVCKLHGDSDRHSHSYLLSIFFLVDAAPPPFVYSTVYVWCFTHSNHTTNLWRNGNNIPFPTGTRGLPCDFVLHRHLHRLVFSSVFFFSFTFFSLLGRLPLFLFIYLCLCFYL